MIEIVAANDPGSTRLVYAMVVGLAVIGVLLVVLGVWLIRQTRVDPPLLAPLERMGERDWAKRDGPTQRRLLDEVRPEGAAPLRLEPDPPVVDEDFAFPPATTSLDDLGPGLGADEDVDTSVEAGAGAESWPEPEPVSPAVPVDAVDDTPHHSAVESWSPPLPAPVAEGATPDELPAPETSG